MKIFYKLYEDDNDKHDPCDSSNMCMMDAIGIEYQSDIQCALIRDATDTVVVLKMSKDKYIELLNISYTKDKIAIDGTLGIAFKYDFTSDDGPEYENEIADINKTNTDIDNVLKRYNINEVIISLPFTLLR